MANANPGGGNSELTEFYADPDIRTIFSSERSCVGLSNIFFHHDPSDPKASIELADIEQDRPRKLCSACPVLENCISYAARKKMPGFWGSTTDERKGVYAARHINPAKLDAAVRATRHKGDLMPDAAALSDEQIIMNAKTSYIKSSVFAVF